MKLQLWTGVMIVLASLAIGTATSNAHAAIVDRVVAVVGDRPVLLSDLRHRARPFLIRVATTTADPSQQAAAESEIFRELLGRIIDERLEAQAADRARVVITPAEVDAAIDNVASRAGLRPGDLVAEAARQGLPEQDYRDEIRRQLLEGKLLELRVRGRVATTDRDPRAIESAMEQARQRFLTELRQNVDIDVRL